MFGETSRPLVVRMKEHKDYIKRREFEKSKMCEYTWQNSHFIVWKKDWKGTIKRTLKKLTKV